MKEHCFLKILTTVEEKLSLLLLHRRVRIGTPLTLFRVGRSLLTNNYNEHIFLA